MIKIENDCVDCGLPCRFGSCPYYRVEHHYCDKCGYEDVLYDFFDEELCKDCLMEEISVTDDADCCDECGDNEDIELYEYDGRHLCENCLLKDFPISSEE